MKKIVLPAILAIVLLCTCNKDDENADPPITPPDYLAEVSIDAAGGTLIADNFEMLVPAGAFNVSSDIKLKLDDTDKPFEENQLTPLYILEGLPEIISAPITIAIKYPTSKEENFISVGTEGYVSSLDTIVESYTIVSTESNAGWYSCILPAVESKENDKSTSGNTFNLKFTVIGGYQYFGEDTHFKIYTPPSMLENAQELHTFFENAYDIIYSEPLSFDQQRDWPVVVILRKLKKSTVYGYYFNYYFGKNFGYIEINKDRVHEIEQMRVTSGHEFFHLVQSLYDYRSIYSKAKIKSSWHWLNEAVSVWSEEKFASYSGYISGTRNTNEMAPFEGAEVGALINAQDHGYGMSSLVKYYEIIYGESIMKSFYENMEEGDRGVDMVSVSPAGPLGENYVDFLEEYILGNVYNNVVPALLVQSSSGQFLVSDEADSSMVFIDSYPDLSGRLYKITLQYPEMDSSAYLECTVDGTENSYLSLFKYHAGEIELLANNSSKIIQTGIKESMVNDWQFLLLVTNKHAISPYIQGEYFELTTRIKKPESYLPPHLDFSFGYDGYFKWDYEDSIYYYHDGWNSIDMVHNGAMGEELYIATWDTVNIDDWTFKGNLSADFDMENQKINWIRIRAMMNTGTVKDTISFVVESIPAEYWDENYKYLKIEGADILNHITSIYYRRFAYGSTLELQDYDCLNSCFFSITLEKD